MWIRPEGSCWQWTVTFNCQKHDWHVGVIPGQTWWQRPSFTFWISQPYYGSSSSLWAGMTQTLVPEQGLSNLTSKQTTEDIDSTEDQNKSCILKSFLLIGSNYTKNHAQRGWSCNLVVKKLTYHVESQHIMWNLIINAFINLHYNEIIWFSFLVCFVWTSICLYQLQSWINIIYLIHLKKIECCQHSNSQNRYPCTSCCTFCLIQTLMKIKFQNHNIAA